MTIPLSVFTLSYVLLVVASLSAANFTPSSNNSRVRPRPESQCHNIYNSFYGGSSKKIEALLLREVKNELREMIEEIQSLKGNKTMGKGMQNFDIDCQN